MARLNKKPKTKYTHEGAKACHITPEQELKRTVMTCMLWENNFYESGISVTNRIMDLVPKIKAEKVQQIAINARNKSKLRHVPLLIVRVMVSLPTHKHLVSDTLCEVIQRPDELTEFLSMYWKDGRKPIAKQIKKGLAKAFNKFSAYQLAKYNRDNAIKLRDVLFLTHAKPKDKEQEIVWKKLIEGTLETPDTWEVALSTIPKDVKDKESYKKGIWERLLTERKLGALALIRNLRNMTGLKVKKKLIKDGIKNLNGSRVLPFRFISAAKHNPSLENDIEGAMLKCLSNYEKMNDKTILLIDVSGSMTWNVSDKSDINRLDAACGVAMLSREIFDDIQIITFSNSIVEVPARHGFSLKDAIYNSQPRGGTMLGNAINWIDSNLEYDRIIIITDEQSHDDVRNPKGKSYIVNVASYQNGVNYGNSVHINGWSESVIDFIIEYEKETESGGNGRRITDKEVS
jgi:hypothetical protein